jgi:putative addiction module component (TIGR02574 family)
LEPDTDNDVDAAWAAEVERRSREIKEGIVRPIPWAEVKSQARKRVRGRS